MHMLLSVVIGAAAGFGGCAYWSRSPLRDWDVGQVIAAVFFAGFAALLGLVAAFVLGFVFDGSVLRFLVSGGH